MLNYILFLLLFPSILLAKHLHAEKDYQEHFCKQIGGITEYRLKDMTRVDCLVDQYAIEVDFAPKWAESIGQSLYYASQTSRKPAVLLIIEDDEKDLKYLRRLEDVSQRHKIDIWIINKKFEVKQHTVE